MARPRATPEQRAEERRLLRQAASELYGEGGAGAVTVRSVTKRAGVSSGALYNAFSGLPELMRSLWVGPVIEAGRRIEELAAATPDPLERIRAILHGFVDFVVEHPDVHRNVLLYVRPSSMPEPPAQPADQLPMFALIRRAIEDGQHDGSIRPGDPSQLAQLLWAGVHGALALPINTEIYALDAGDKIAPDMIDLLVQAVSNTT